MTKKRDLLARIDDCIKALTAMHVDAAKLEYTDNSQASKRLKRAIIDFRHKELNDLHSSVLEVRVEMRERPKRGYNKKELTNKT